MVRLLACAILFAVSIGPALACDSKPEPWPLQFGLGPVTLRPSGFFEAIGMIRSATTGDSVSTRFARIPLQDTSTEALVSAGHSRLQICGQAGNLSVYLETDFLDAPGQNPYRFRQYWTEYRMGKWRFLGGQAWSLLRPNRSGISSEGSLMNTFVVDPAYHAGLAGGRNRQVRITRDAGAWQIALSYESGRNILAKIARDSKRIHFEAAGLGSVHRRALSLAAVVHASRRLDWISQQIVSRGAGPQLVGAIPPDVVAHAAIQGIETRIRPTLELFLYGGITYGSRSPGNRTVRQWTAGFIRHLFETQPWGAASIAVQFSQTDRSTWPGDHGSMNYVQMSFRYSMPGSRSLFSRRSARRS